MLRFWLMQLRPVSSSCTRWQHLVLTDRAVQRLKRIANEGECLRITVEGGGCSGFEYKLALDKTQSPDDVLIEKDGAKVLVDQVYFFKGTLFNC